MLLEYPYKSFSLETQIWRVGKGETQGLTLLPRGQLRSIIACCWKENLQHRPTFKDILVIIEHDVSVYREEGGEKEGRLWTAMRCLGGGGGGGGLA